LPLYPKFSTTTTASSIKAWKLAAAKVGLNVPTTSVCCYPTEEGMIRAQADLLKETLKLAGGEARVLFSAHGLPKKVIERGDPYQRQVEMTAAAIVKALGQNDLDWLVSYQSRVGPLEWIGPGTDDEIRRAGRDQKALVVQPIAFVSEHSETLVELDIEYAHLAREAGVPRYFRVPALGDHPAFIAALADLVTRARTVGFEPCSGREGLICKEARIVQP
jgi:ferrochelatase